MRLRFYKFRAVVLLLIVKFLTKILFVETPPLVSVVALIKKNDKVLFLNLSYSKGLALPGGIVKGGETLEDALKREVLEETGLKVTNLKYFNSVKSFNYHFPVMAVAFLVEVSGEVKSSNEGKLTWIKPEEALEKLFYNDNKEILKEFVQV